MVLDRPSMPLISRRRIFIWSAGLLVALRLHFSHLYTFVPSKRGAPGKTGRLGPKRAAKSSLLESSGVDDLITWRSVKERRLRQASVLWRKEGANWTDEEIEEEGSGSDSIANLKHGTNLLLNGAHEFVPWADVRAEHAERGHEWMEKFSVEEIWAHHCRVPFVGDDWRMLLDPLERIVDKVELAFLAVKHVKDVLDPSVKFRKAYRLAAQARWNIERRLRRCDRFSRAFLQLLAFDQNSTEAQRRAAAHLMILFEQDGVNLQHNGIYRDDPEAFLELQKVRAAVFNISLIWDYNIDRDLENRAYLIRDPSELDGLPEWILRDAVEMAQQAGYPKANLETGPWLVTLHDAVVEGIMKHAKGRGLREVVHENRARIAFQGGTGKGDNTPVLEQLLRMRRRFANVVGYRSHGDVVFTKSMATPKQAYGLLSKLRQEALPVARYEVEQLRSFAKEQGAKYELDHFDLEYWRERMLEDRFGLKEEYIRQFFPLDAVLQGLFNLLERLFNVKVIQEETKLAWSSGVTFYRLKDLSNKTSFVSSVFFDPFRRSGKRRGFWSSKIQGYSELLGDRNGPRRPAVNVVADLERPQEGQSQPLLTHREVVQVFRVFGSALRELFCEQSEGLMSGANGLEVDVLELPSHFLARWAYDEETLRRCSRHHATGEPLPAAALAVLAQTRKLYVAHRLLKRCALAHVDLEMHSDYDPYSDLNIYDLAKLIEAEYAVIRPRVQDRELCSLPFHDDRFAGALYGDLWAEALAADAFAAFDAASPDGLRAQGRRFRELVLAPGGGRAPGDALQEFLQRPPAFSSMLRDAGLIDSEIREAADVAAEEEEEGTQDISYEELYPDADRSESESSGSPLDDDDDEYAEFEDY
ncbi:unnamed protein product [Durusdinium trenchii]|uniref:Chloroplastic/mitochondrial (Thimet metalloendopeptidase 1) (Zincin-like metalloproteases family protein 1) n=2 Tax=Durusdinium trenchii TaxID=1381693 RepID=A0ABP0HE85_9DINO